MEFEYTAPGTPKQIIPLEWKFTNLFNWVYVKLNGRKFTDFLQNSLWAKATNTATLLENNLVTPHRDSSPFHYFLEREQLRILSLV